MAKLSAFLLLIAVALVTGDKWVRYDIFAGCETWYNARDICNEKGGTLAKITDNITQTHLVFLIKERHQLNHIDFWFSAQDIGEEGHWRTEDGEFLRYFNWAKGQPNNGEGSRRCGGNQHCAELSQDNNFRWKDDLCDSMKGYICQYTEDNRTKKKKYKIADVTSTQAAASYNHETPNAVVQTDVDMVEKAKVIETAERVVVVVLALSLVNLLILIGMVVIFYTIVWRKMQTIIVQEPVYKDLVNQSSTNNDNS